MASIKLLLPLAALLLATSLGASSQLVAAKEVPAPPGGAAAGFDAEAACRKLAEYPKLCERLAEVYKPASGEALVEAAINESTSRAEGAKKVFDSLLQSNEDESVADPLRRCSMVFERVAYYMGESLRRIREGRRKSGAARISSAKMAIEFCYDIFDPAHDYNGLMDFPGKRTYTTVKKTVANAYRLACDNNTDYCHYI